MNRKALMLLWWGEIWGERLWCYCDVKYEEKGFDVIVMWWNMKRKALMLLWWGEVWRERLWCYCDGVKYEEKGFDVIVMWWSMKRKALMLLWWGEIWREKLWCYCDVVKYEEKALMLLWREEIWRKKLWCYCDGDFNVRIGLGAEELPNSNGKRLLVLVRVEDHNIENQLQCCYGRWTWGSDVRKSVIDYMLFSCSDVMVGWLGEVVEEVCNRLHVV